MAANIPKEFPERLTVEPEAEYLTALSKRLNIASEVQFLSWRRLMLVSSLYIISILPALAFAYTSFRALTLFR